MPGPPVPAWWVARPAPVSRRGFTLTELLVVMLIIGILLALAISALLGALGTSSAAATRALIEKVDRGLMDRLASLENRRIEVLPIDTLLAFDGDNQPGDDSSDEPLRALVIAKKRLVKEEFPQWFEIVDPASNPPLIVGDWDPIDLDGNGMADQVPAQLSPVAQGYRRTVLEHKWDESPIPAGSCPSAHAPGNHRCSWRKLAENHNPRTTSAECLYLILTQGPGSTSVDATEFGSRDVADTDGDGLPELIDGYGLPIRFFRWPTHYRSPLQKGAAPYAVGERREEDPTDQNRLLLLRAWWQTNVMMGFNKRLVFENARSVWPAVNGMPGAMAFHSVSESPSSAGVAWAWNASLGALNPNYGIEPPLAARAYYTQPLIVSSGPDERFGLDVLPDRYLQARILADWYADTATYQAAVQGNLFAESMGGFEDQVGAHLDNFTNHDLRSNQ